MKKEYIILTVLIVLLGAYLVLHKENRDNYTLPEIAKIDITKATGIILDKKDESIKFIKKDDKWTLTDKNYPADAPSMKNMLDTFKNFKLSALVSQKGDLKRYELDDKNSIHVKLMQDSKNIFQFSMGKTAPSFNHTFVMLDNDKNVYHAGGSFRSYFDKTKDDFRDKKVLEFSQEAIKQFTIEKEGSLATLVLKEEKKQEEKSGSEKPDPEKLNPKKLDRDEKDTSWLYENKALADKEAVLNLLSSVSFLECEKYLSTPEKKELEKSDPFCRIILKNKENLSLTLFKTDTPDHYMGISSMNDYSFDLSQFDGKQIVSNIESLLNPNKETPGEEQENTDLEAAP